ncbi:DsbA family protein [Zymomonas mobilis]|uniref:Thioredoxin-like fold domain-containing protein n=1 Tax=Zymomonas mobilis subsp. pomaceae (strain ATCC 29192 / DSM 22645 / JCM 10191 / CCUG 17912 / NBRC 13757 / NCIMB 11200 / NRRL B-4491 / Barker I) TaxID=579138 RepID=F8EVJ4_ZYMMT|nr:thioredoxin domain-containing protein [Zymomonas mobilis]AEI38331.1 hypothetical protein Zymop_1441 [Zymomonas mobilis subsp. pomaceae ATCC 29192]MDX5948020.1 thioredoxin domain-containing protein [Zymomonas mobilis subsp. pomaceae]GEB89350.1 thiol-disulfide oxidoreductase [Zymomonas mobilis subsp. pomaceae]
MNDHSSSKRGYRGYSLFPLLSTASALTMLFTVPVFSASPIKSRPSLQLTHNIQPDRAKDWGQRVSETSFGSYVIGNPDAPVKLLEYLSLTCPHCAELTRESLQPLMHHYISKGLVSLEIRHAVRDAFDATATLLVRCGDRQHYIDRVEQIFNNQNRWMDSAIEFSQKQAKVRDNISYEAFFQKAATDTGLIEMMKPVGLTSDQSLLCLKDPVALDLLKRQSVEIIEKSKIPGTPYLLLNGRPITDSRTKPDWAIIDSKIKAALQKKN